MVTKIAMKAKAKLKSASKAKVKPRTISEHKEARPMGRPTVMTPETLAKLSEAFAMGCSDEEACLFADINKSTLTRYCEVNEDFCTYKEVLKKNPVLKARQVLLNHLKLDDKDIAKYVVDKHDGKAKQSVDVSGEMTNNIKVAIVQFSDGDDDKEQDGGQD